MRCVGQLELPAGGGVAERAVREVERDHPVRADHPGVAGVEPDQCVVARGVGAGQRERPDRGAGAVGERDRAAHVVRLEAARAVRRGVERVVEIGERLAVSICCQRTRSPERSLITTRPVSDPPGERPAR